MAAKFRNLIASRARLQLVESAAAVAEVPAVRQLQAHMRLTGRVAANNRERPFSIRLPAGALGLADAKAAGQFVERFETDELLPSVSLAEARWWEEEEARPAKRGKKKKKAKGETVPQFPCLRFDLPRRDITINTLRFCLGKRRPFRCRGIFPEEDELAVLVDFSSPNVAKPFHFGHFRSTIMGNFCAKINESVGHQVTRINYLGDMGTQFGLILAGLEEAGQTVADVVAQSGESDEEAVRRISQLYVEANAKAEADPDFRDRAAELSARLEDRLDRSDDDDGDAALAENWRRIRELTVRELERTYARLGIRFDEYHGEAMYCGRAWRDRVSALLRGRGLLREAEDGSAKVSVRDGYTKERDVQVLKSGGAGLYLQRDIAAALDRHERYHPDRLLYVTDNGQLGYFGALFFLLRAVAPESFADPESLRHVPFGRVEGMSSRRGTAVLLRDLLDAAAERMAQSMADSKNTRAEAAGDTPETLGLTALAAGEMDRNRQKDASFSWEKVMGESKGVSLQYAHCRLVSLLRRAESDLGIALQEITERESIDENVAGQLTEPECLNLILQLARFDEAVRDAYVSLEPVVLLDHLCEVSSATSRALRRLPVLRAESRAAAETRTVLFAAARAILQEGMDMLGFRVLHQM